MTEMVHRWRRFFTSLWTVFNEKNCRQNAAALTYMTLFAIVPLVTVSYAMLSLFPDFAGLESKIQQQIFSHFVPESGREVQEYINNFSVQAQRLTGAGIAILLLTAGFMLKNIESTFNAIWDIPKGRKGVSSFLLYWAILSLGPILLGAGMAATTYLFSQKVIAQNDSLGLLPVVLRVLPFIFTAIAFTLLFVAVPNCRVPLRHGFAGGVITAIAFEAAKYLFGAIVSRSSVQAIYGAFAFVPLFLIWIYTLWMIVLAGCVLVRTLSAYHAAAQGRNYSDLVATLVLMSKFFGNYQKGLPVSEQDISRAGIRPAQWRRIREILQINKVIAQTERNDHVLVRDLDSITLRQMLDWLHPAPVPEGGHRELQARPWFREVDARFREAQDFSHAHLSQSLGDLFRDSMAKEILEKSVDTSAEAEAGASAKELPAPDKGSSGANNKSSSKGSSRNARAKSSSRTANS
ncbi:YihY family inner membrane protein [Microbulbifer sp. CAU 1566]|uniref:YihY family inner membrane protein n=1 Tax=Microbulbifer sp. CAU 1566 TaxID=2933269 RepID=UPI00200666D8|nr:YihY family inner membrane protein [Microbulbifer sp. CAU 1566]MCK7595758.1 YihY family inner membrane protein [Microbulbifer sp. CAU 1566]